MGVASGSGWNLWVWLLGVVVRRYIDFLILLIPTPLVSVLFYSSLCYLGWHGNMQWVKAGYNGTLYAISVAMCPSMVICSSVAAMWSCALCRTICSSMAAV